MGETRVLRLNKNKIKILLPEILGPELKKLKCFNNNCIKEIKKQLKKDINRDLNGFVENCHQKGYKFSINNKEGYTGTAIFKFKQDPDNDNKIYVGCKVFRSCRTDIIGIFQDYPKEFDKYVERKAIRL